MEKRRGVSPVIATVLLVVLVVIAVLIIAGIIRPMIEENLKKGKSCFELRDYFRILDSKNTCYNNADTKLMVERGLDDINVRGFAVSIVTGKGSRLFKVINGSGSSSGVEMWNGSDFSSEIEVPGKGEARTYKFPVGNGKKVKIAVIQENGDVCESWLYNIPSCVGGVSYESNCYWGSSGGKCKCPEGLVSYWSFDNVDCNTGTTVEDEVGNNDGVLCKPGTNNQPECSITHPDDCGDVPKTIDGKVGNALNFSGIKNVSVKVNHDDSLKITGNITISVWVKRTRLDHGMFDPDIILNKGGDWTASSGGTNYGLGLHNKSNDNMLYFYYKKGWKGTSLKGIADDTTDWHHFVVIAENGTPNIKFYVDGEERNAELGDEENSEIHLYPSSLPLYIGSQNDIAYHYYGKNLIDEVAIFNRTLNEREIQALYELGRDGKKIC